MKSQHIDRAFALQAALFQFRRPTDLSEVPGRAQTIDLPQTIDLNEGAVSWLNWNSVKLEATKIEYYVPRFRSQKNLKS